MAFVIIGPRSQAALDSQDEALLHELPRRYGLRTPRCDYLWDRSYADPRLASVDEVSALGEEMRELRAAHARARAAELTRTRKIKARDEAVRSRIVEELLADDPVLRKCDEIVAVCRDAVAAGAGLSCSSD